MQIQVNTDHNIPGHEALVTKVEETIMKALQRFGKQITRVEVHLSDDNGNKSGANDKRCVMWLDSKGISRWWRRIRPSR